MLWAMQKGVYGALTGNTALSAKVGGRIFDQPPQNAAFPYIVVGEGTAEPWDTDTEVGADAVVTIHVWDRSHGGRRIVKETQDLIWSVLHRTEPTIEGFTTVLCEIEFSESFMDADGKTFHGVQRFRLVIERQDS